MKRYLCRFPVTILTVCLTFYCARSTKYNQYESMIFKSPVSTGEPRSVDYGMDVGECHHQRHQWKGCYSDCLREERLAAKPLTNWRRFGVYYQWLLHRYLLLWHQTLLQTSKQRQKWRGVLIRKNIAARAGHASAANPDNFCSDFEATKLMSAGPSRRRRDHQEDYWRLQERSGKSLQVSMSKIVPITGTSRGLSNHSSELRDKDTVLIWVYAPSTNKPGNFIRKPCVTALVKFARSGSTTLAFQLKRLKTGQRTAATLQHAFMPYINAFFQPSRIGLVVPEGAVNFAFYWTACRDSSWHYFTTEYSIRTGMELSTRRWTLIEAQQRFSSHWWHQRIPKANFTF